MRTARLSLRTGMVRPGEVLDGHVIVSCDEPFNPNRVGIRITGVETTEITLGDDTYRDTYTHISEYVVLSEAPEIRDRDTAYPFEFTIPKGIPRSYDGYNSKIKYHAKAIVEVDWRPDPTHTQEFFVVPHSPPFIQLPAEPHPISGGWGPLSVLLPTGVLQIGKGLHVKMMIQQKKNVDRILVSLAERVVYTCRGHEGKSERTIITMSRNIGPDDFGRWLDCWIGEHWDNQVPIDSRLITVDYIVKAVLGVKWNKDPSLSLPIRISGPDPIEDVLDEIELDLGMA
jgi:hypothetical protein